MFKQKVSPIQLNWKTYCEKYSARNTKANKVLSDKTSSKAHRKRKISPIGIHWKSYCDSYPVRNIEAKQVFSDNTSSKTHYRRKYYCSCGTFVFKCKNIEHRSKLGSIEYLFIKPHKVSAIIKQNNSVRCKKCHYGLGGFCYVQGNYQSPRIRICRHAVKKSKSVHN